MTPQDLIKQSKSICEAATPGPFRMESQASLAGDSRYCIKAGPEDVRSQLIAEEISGANAKFIATARTLVPELAKDLDMAHSRIAQIASEVGAYASSLGAVSKGDQPMEIMAAIEKLKRERDEARELLKVMQGRHQIASIAVASGLNPDATLDELYEHLAELRDG